MSVWRRSEVSFCSCPSLNYTHTHCPCNRCLGRATSRATEYRHWTDAIFAAKSVSVNEPASKRARVDGDGGNDPAESTAELNHEEARVEDDELQLAHTTIQPPGAGTSSEEPDISTQNQSTISTETIPSTLNIGTIDDNTDLSSNVSNDAVRGVVEVMQLADSSNSSEQQFSEILRLTKESYRRGLIAAGQEIPEDFDSMWPDTLQGATKILKDLGYQSPTKYLVCLSSSHTWKWDVTREAESCRHCGEKGAIPYYYLSLSDKIRRWCSCESFCDKMTGHWRHKESWFNKPGGSFPKREIWDGARFAELSWFFDPDNTWMLPVRCSDCLTVISATKIAQQLTNQDQTSQGYNICCNECHSIFYHYPQYARGDPRNLALIGHWDGFQPFRSTGKHGCGSIDFSIATMEKKDRAKTDEVYVAGFVPSYLLPHKRPHSLDPFLDPLLTEIENIFIQGIEVDYMGSVAGIEPGKATLRCIILCWTGDYPAQCEIGKFIKNGKHPCRRDTLEGSLIENQGSHYYFGDCRLHVKHPWERRSLSDCIEDMHLIEDEDRISVRGKLAKEKGFTGLSELHRLNALYGFNIIEDMVFDAMHNIPLNVASQHLHYYAEKDMLPKAEVEQRLNHVPWTSELKSGRVPQGITHRLGFWKAEDLQKFTFPASECVLGGLLPEKEYHIWILVVRLTELVFGAGRDGWTEEMLDLARNLIWRHNILVEETHGLKSCHVTLHNLEHIIDDIERFSSPDNCWCYQYERAVMNYVETPTNKKNIESTLAKSEAKREFLKFLRGNRLQKGRNLPYLQPGDMVCANTLQMANQLASSYPQLCLAGVLVGKVTYDDPGYHASSIFMPKHGHKGRLYRVGEFLLVNIGDDEKGNVIRLIDVVYYSSTHSLYAKGEIYPFKKDDSDELELHIYSSSPLVIPSATQMTVSTNKILRKVMLYPQNSLEDPHEYILIDYLRPTIPLCSKDVLVPFFPEKDDMVKVTGSTAGQDPWIAHILDVDKKRKTCHVHFYVETAPQSKLWHRESMGRRSRETVQWGSILCLAQGSWHGRQWRMH